MSKNKITYSMPPPMPIALKNTVARDVISASEQEAFIINVINNAIKNGKLDTGRGVNDLELDSMETSSASINKGNFKEIGSIGESITFSSESIFTSYIKIGPITSTWNNNYQFQLFEDMLVNGNTVDLLVSKLTSKSNILQLGIDNTASDNFLQGITFIKRDNFSSQGSTIIDRTGIITLPYGEFLDDKTYAPITNTKKRFEGARTNTRFVYLNSELTFGDKISSDNEFTLNQQNFINDLNNITNQASIYYTNIESNNLHLHGGIITVGLGKSMEFYLTKTNAVEERFFGLDLESELVSFDKGFKLNMVDFKIESSGSVGFTSESFLNALINSGQINFYRPVQFYNGSPIVISGDNLEFRDSLANPIIKLTKKETNYSDDRIEDITFNYYTGTFLTQGRFGDVELEISDYTKISGPAYNSGASTTTTNNKDNPTLQIQNKENYAELTNLPSTKTYLQSKFLEPSSTSTFSFANICTTSQNDFIFSGFIIISATDSNDSSHLHLRLDGSYNNKDTNNPSILTKTVIKRNILTLESIHFTESVDYNNSIAPVLDLLLTNSLSKQFNITIKLEVISI